MSVPGVDLLHALVAIARVLRQLKLPGGLVTLAFAALLAAGALEAVSVGMLIPLLSSLIGEDSSTGGLLDVLSRALPGRDRETYVVLLAGIILVLVGTKNLAAYASSYFLSTLREKAAVRLRADLFERVLRAAPDSLTQLSSGGVSSAFLTDAARVLRAVDFCVVILQRGVLTVSYFAAILWISWELTLMTCALGILLGAVAYSTSRFLLHEGRTLTAASMELARRVTEAYGGIRTVRTTGSEDREAERFAYANRAQARSEAAQTRAGSRIAALVETLGVAGAMLLVALAYRYQLSRGSIGVSEFLAFGFGLIRILPSLAQLYGLQGNVLALAGSAEVVQRWYALPSFPSRPFGQLYFSDVRSEVRFESLGFQYASAARPALDDVTLVVPAGATVAIVGSSGSGKTTLASLLLRLREPAVGRILIDGVDHWEFSHESFCRAVAWVEQDPFLFEGTLYENVAYGLPDAPREAVMEALRVARLGHFLETLPRGLETPIGERGATLSGGQRQRVAIARALLRGPRILVMDEPTSALDPTTEREVVEAMDAARMGRTTFVITHREDTLATADIVVHIHEGRVIGQSFPSTRVANAAR